MVRVAPVAWEEGHFCGSRLHDVWGPPWVGSAFIRGKGLGSGIRGGVGRSLARGAMWSGGEVELLRVGNGDGSSCWD